MKLKDIVIMERQNYLVTTVYSDGTVNNAVYYSAGTALSSFIETKQKILHDDDIYLSISLYMYLESENRYDLITSIIRKL